MKREENKEWKIEKQNEKKMEGTKKNTMNKILSRKIVLKKESFKNVYRKVMKRKEKIKIKLLNGWLKRKKWGKRKVKVTLITKEWREGKKSR